MWLEGIIIFLTLGFGLMESIPMFQTIIAMVLLAAFSQLLFLGTAPYSVWWAWLVLPIVALIGTLLYVLVIAGFRAAIVHEMQRGGDE